ncbi:contact-dependent growth inhibition system immunity protein [Streptomyces laurentii]
MLPSLLPLALEILRDDPMAEGHMYEGDLLSAVVKRSPDVREEWPELRAELVGILSELGELPSFFLPEVRSTARELLSPGPRPGTGTGTGTGTG